MQHRSRPLSEQVVVITGASSGIGLATALGAAKQGAKVVLAARSEATLHQIVADIVGFGGEAVAVAVDVGSRADLERVAQLAVERFGRVDTWVNNAGVSIFGRIDEVEQADSERMFQTNFWGVVHGSLAALPLLKESGGTLINLGSELSEAIVPLQGMYSASKHAVKGFTDALRLELQADGSPVQVTLIQPTAVDTPYAEHAGSYLSQEPKLPTPMVEPEKVASAILDAAVDPTDAVKVGAMSVLNTATAKLFSTLFGSMAKKQMGRQQRNEPPHARHGNLYAPSEDGRVHGRGNDNAAGTKQALASNLRTS